MEEVRVSEVYTSTMQYRPLLNAKLCSEKKLWGAVLTVSDVRLATIRGRQKIVLSFKELQDAELALNSTNANTLADAWGDDAGKWIGKKLRIVKVRRTYEGKAVDAIQTVPE